MGPDWRMVPHASGVDVSCAMVKAGYAVRWARHGGDRVCR